MMVDIRSQTYSYWEYEMATQTSVFVNNKRFCTVGVFILVYGKHAIEGWRKESASKGFCCSGSISTSHMMEGEN